MSAPAIPPENSQAVSTTGGVQPFTTQWYNFFSGLLSYITTGPIGPIALIGVTDGSNAAAGDVGEYLSSIVLASAGINLPNDTSETITSLQLTPGDWDLWGEVIFNPPTGGGTAAYSAAALWTTGANAFPASNLIPADGATAADFNQILYPNTATDVPTLYLGPMRVNITTNVTFFLSAFADFGGGVGPTMSAGGAIRARRMR